MPAKIIWSPSSIADVGDIVAYISADNPSAALRVGNGIIEAIDRLAVFPQLGHPFGDANKPALREITFSHYRIIYRLTESGPSIVILRIWHGARGRPELPNF